LATKKDFIVKNGLVVTDDITLDDGGSLKEAGGTAAFTFDGDGNVTKIGQDSPSNGEFLKWDGSKWVADAAGGGGASVLGDLTDVLIDATNFTDGFLIQPNSNGLAPTTGTLSTANNNIGIGSQAFTSLTTGDNNTVYGNNNGNALTTGFGNSLIGTNAGQNISTSVENVGVGYRVLGNSAASPGSYNVGIGSYVFWNSSFTGTDNVGIGRQAGRDLTSATSVVLIGRYAGTNLTTGSDNVLIGGNAGDDLTTATRNVFVGKSAGNTSTGGSNVGIGYNAASSMGTATSSVHIGNNAGFGTTGALQVSVGNYALNGSCTGTVNVAIGNQTMGSSSGASAYNTALGGRALRYLSGGSNNIGVGYEAGQNISSGNNNISIGYQAGDNITSGSNNVVIGAADVPSATGDDQLSISNGDGTVQWIEGNSSGVVLGALTPLFFERSALDTNSIDFRVPVAGSGPATPNAYPMPYDGEILAASFLFSGATITGTASNTLRVRKNGGSSGADIEDFTFTPSDLTNPTGTNYTLVKTGLSLAFNAGDIIQVRRNSGTTDLNNAQAIVWVRYNM
jgi:hypothetical protein